MDEQIERAAEVAYEFQRGEFNRIHAASAPVLMRRVEEAAPDNWYQIPEEVREMWRQTMIRGINAYNMEGQA
jgi:hypothetical protein